jgi:hypothetical protein
MAALHLLPLDDDDDDDDDVRRGMHPCCVDEEEMYLGPGRCAADLRSDAGASWRRRRPPSFRWLR